MARSSLGFDPKRLAQAVVDDMLNDLGLKRRGTLATVMGGFSVFALGMLAGATIAFFMAPRSGKDFRGDITQWVSELREQMNEKFQSTAKRGERYNPPS